MNPIASLLKNKGPMRSGAVAEWLQTELSISPEAARKRISRTRPPIRKFPIQLLPKGEGFLYLQEQRTSESFWTAFRSALRETNSVYGHATDALVARGGVIPVEEFATISGAPLAMKGQIAADRLLDTLIKAGMVTRGNHLGIGDSVITDIWALGAPDRDGFRAKQLAEGIVLDGAREWMRKIGMVSYNAVAIRGDKKKRTVGQFQWDLTAPSYLLPLKRGEGRPGFVVADVFVDTVLDEFDIRYFIRKAELLKASVPVHVLPILIAEGFSNAALRTGKTVGLVMATLTNLFGRRVGGALQSLIQVLKNAAAVAASNPAKLAELMDDLTEIEGAAGNLRGVLFELIVAYLARLDARSVDMAITARDRSSGKSADIDVLQVRSKAKCICIECKAKSPGGEVTLDEVEDWFARIPTFRDYLRNHDQFREAQHSFELWTTGTFTRDALAKLRDEKHRRTKSTIDWKDGQAVSQIAKNAKEKAIRVALDNHFLRHPLSTEANGRELLEREAI